MVREGCDLVPDLAFKSVGNWIRAAHDVTHHIAAGSECGEQGRSNRLQYDPQVGFQHAVELEILACGQAETSVAQLGGNLIMGEILLWGNASAGNPGANHERVCFALCFLFARLSIIPVLLLVHAMKLENPG